MVRIGTRMGTRPDGYSLHLTEKDRMQFVKEYWEKMPKEVPEEYSREDSEPYLCDVDEKTFQEIKKSKNGIRCNDTPPKRL